MQTKEQAVPQQVCTEETKSNQKLLNHRYAFIKKLGQGIYGTVYLASDTKNGGRLVALKREIKPDNYNAREGYSVTLLREINVLQELGSGPNKHPCMVELVEVFQLRDGSPCIAIEFLEKGSLMDLLQSQPGEAKVPLRPEHIKNLAF